MTSTRKRTILYTTSIVFAMGLLFAGFGITIPADPGTRLHGAQLVASLGEYDRALEMCDTVLEEHPDNIDARVFRATFLAQAERYDEALEAYDDAIEHAEKASLVRSLRADRASVLLHAGREAEYKRERDKLAAERVDHVIHMLDGIAARRHRKWDEAAAAFRRAIELDAENRTAHSLLVDVLVSKGDEALAARRFEDAKKAYAASREIDPERVDLALKVAEVHLALEQELEAAKVLEKVGLNKRGVAPLLCRAAKALWERGEKEAAMGMLATAYRADATSAAALFKQDPAWSELRRKTSLEKIVSERDSGSSGGLTDKGTGIVSPRQGE